MKNFYLEAATIVAPLLLSCFFFNASIRPVLSPFIATQATAIPIGDACNNATATCKPIPVINNTWCYNVYVNNNLMIQQPSKASLNNDYWRQPLLWYNQ